jgi:DNA repair protein RAD50
MCSIDTQVCIRSLQLTQKKTKMEQRTLDGVMIMVDPETGEVRVLRVCPNM